MPLARAVLEHFRLVPGLEIHLLVSKNAEKVLAVECAQQKETLSAMATCSYEPDNLGAPPASGSWLHDGMVICPCSMSSLCAIASGFGSSLAQRSADVCLKERRPLILVTRESPLNLIHLRNMVQVTEAGAIVMPFAPVFYHDDDTMSGAFRQFSGRLLDLLHIPHEFCRRWQGA